MSFVNAEEDADHDHDERDQADLERGEPRLRVPRRLMRFTLPVGSVPWLPGVLPITVCPAA